MNVDVLPTLSRPARHRAFSGTPFFAARAPADLGCPGMAALVRPFGVNLDMLPHKRPVRDLSGPLELMLVATDWERKGGDIAVAALDVLRARGRDARPAITGAR